MKKNAMIVAMIILVFSLLSFTACEKGALTLKVEDTIYISRNNGLPVSYLIDCEANGISESDVKITCDNDLIYFQDGMLKIGSKLGESSCTIKAKGKSAKIKLYILKKLDSSEKEYEEGTLTGVFANYYLAAKSLINCLEDFKSPESVEVVDCWSVNFSNGIAKYFIYKIRAHNSFGANVLNVYRIDAGGYTIKTATVPNYGDYDYSYASSIINDYIKDYISD